MGNVRGIKRDFKALERRRFEALKLLKKGYNQSEVGRRTKVCSQTVSRWARMVAEEGDRALEAVGRAGASRCWRKSSGNSWCRSCWKGLKNWVTKLRCGPAAGSVI